MKRFAWVAVLAGLLLAWEAWVDLRSVPDYLLPSPSGIASALWDERSTLLSQAAVTAREMLLGFALAVILGLGAAILLQRLPWLRSAVYPLLVASQSIPVVAIAPLLVIYLGFGLSPEGADRGAGLLLPDHGQRAGRVRVGAGRAARARCAR